MQGRGEYRARGVACPRCGAGQQERCVSITGRPADLHAARYALAVSAGLIADIADAGPPTAAPVVTAWAELRIMIQRERAAQDDIAAEHAEYGRDGQSERAYGWVNALDWVMATMDRMETGQ